MAYYSKYTGKQLETILDSVSQKANVEDVYNKDQVTNIINDQRDSLIGTTEDTSDKNTIYGAKRYASNDATEKVNEAKEEIKNTTDDLDDRIKTVENNYLTSVDKTELQNNINTVSDIANAAAPQATTYTKTEVNNVLEENVEGYIANSQTVNELIVSLGFKQDLIEDLEDIRSGAALGMTAVLESTLNSLKESIPTKVSELENDEEYMTKSAVDEGYLSLAGGNVNGPISFHGNVCRFSMNQEGDGGEIYCDSFGLGFLIYSKAGNTLAIYDKFVGINNTTPYYALDVNGSIATNTDVFIKEKSVSGFINFYEGSNTATSLSSIPVDKHLCICTVDSSDSLSLSDIPSAGREIHVIIHNTSSDEIAVTLPNSGSYVNTQDTVMSIDANLYGEINLISDGSIVYIKYI